MKRLDAVRTSQAPLPNLQSRIPNSKTLVLGLGNPILSDDGVGIQVVQAAAARRSPTGDVTFAEASVGGLRLLDLLAGYDRVIMVDAIQSRDGRPGSIYRLGPSGLPASIHSGSTHDVSFPEALELGRRLGMALPEDEAIVILAVEVEDTLTFGESCTPAVTAAIPRAVEAVLAHLGRPRAPQDPCEQRKNRARGLGIYTPARATPTRRRPR